MEYRRYGNAPAGFAAVSWSTQGFSGRCCAFCLIPTGLPAEWRLPCPWWQCLGSQWQGIARGGSGFSRTGSFCGAGVLEQLRNSIRRHGRRNWERIICLHTTFFCINHLQRLIHCVFLPVLYFLYLVQKFYHTLQLLQVYGQLK